LGEAWYAVYTRFQHEKSAASLLERKSFEVFLPLYRAVHRWRDRKQTVSLPLFPCYLFLRGSTERKLDILQTAGVHWIVENAGRACEVPEAEIETLRNVCAAAESGRVVRPHPFLRRGETARIRGGPLAGTEKDAALRLFHSPLRRRHCEVFRFLLLGPHKHALRSQQSSGRRPSAKYPIFVRWLFGEINSKGRAAD